MKVMIDSRQEENIDSSIRALNEWWKTATAELYEQNRLIYSVCINKQEMFQGYEQYLMNNIDSIEEINIKSLSKVESIEQTERALIEYIERFTPGSLEVSQYFFGVLTEEHWAKFSDFLTGLEWIVNAIEFDMLLYQQLDIAVPETLKSLNALESHIMELGRSLEWKDHVAVGDIIQYEIVPLLDKYRTDYLKKVRQ